ncbi:hypothetical protein ABEX47_03415 [Paenibacillus ehimensis]|uniref:XkdQ/YqbQ family protein n=1 Tax=Paenibacillus ehimensis TaxID=79264 RepID=UPI003D27E4CE
MQLQIEIDNRDGYVWDISGIVSEATYKTARVGRASSFEMTMIKGGLYEAKEFKYNVGDVVRVMKGEAKVFHGYIFTIEKGRAEDVKITAYDQLRYLMANDHLIDKNKTATQAIQRFAKDFNLKVGKLADTKHVFPKIAEDNSKILDIITKLLQDTRVATLETFVLYDDFGELRLTNIKDMMLDFYLGDTSLVYDYKQKESIENSYNQVKIARDNKEKGEREMYVLRDSTNIAKWGLLQLYQVADEKANAAQINKSMENHLKLKNRVERSFQIEAIGDVRVRAGCGIQILIEEIGTNQQFLVNECTHKFDGADHTMTLDLVDIRKGDVKA